MYNVNFISDDGKQILIGASNGIVADFDFGESVPVDIGTSQGFGQIGETKETESVGSRIINVKGVVFRNVKDTRKMIRKAFAPFTSGMLKMNGYEIHITVKEPPKFATVKNDGRFMMQLLAPYPYFRSIEKKTVLLGEVKPLFKFPVNYSQPHQFGLRSQGKTLKIYNDSDIDVPFSLDIVFNATGGNIILNELKTFKKLKISGSYVSGDTIKLYRDERQILHCELINGSEKTDILDRISEDSDLYYLETGDNLISATDDNEGKGFTLYFSYHTEVVALYED